MRRVYQEKQRMETKKEHCSTNGHIKYAGVQLAVELWGAEEFSPLHKITQLSKEKYNEENLWL